MAKVITERKKKNPLRQHWKNLEKNQTQKATNYFLGNNGYSDFDHSEAAWEIPSHDQILTFSDYIPCGFEKYRLS